MAEKFSVDEIFMRRAWSLALRGKQSVSPNPMVGALIAKKGRVLAEGFHHHPGGPHAEVVAMQKLSARELAGATLYVTLEPCHHYGRTPPCVEAVLRSGIRRVVIGVRDPNPLTCGRSIGKLRRAGLEVVCGVLEQELLVMNEVFNKYITCRLPFVVTKTAETLDGKIATVTGDSQWITSPEARDYAHHLRGDFDAILVGINTVLQDDPSLNAGSRSKRIKKVVVDTALKVPLSARFLQGTAPENCFIATTKSAPADQRKKFGKKGVQVIVCPTSSGRVDLRFLLAELARREVASVLIEGGGQIIGSALKEGLVDKMMFFVAPKILGDRYARNAIDGLGTQHVGDCVNLKRLTVETVGPDVLVTGYIDRRTAKKRRA